MDGSAERILYGVNTIDFIEPSNLFHQYQFLFKMMTCVKILTWHSARPILRPANDANC